MTVVFLPRARPGYARESIDDPTPEPVLIIAFDEGKDGESFFMVITRHGMWNWARADLVEFLIDKNSFVDEFAGAA